MSDQAWYGAKCIFLHTKIESCPGRVYEERIVLERAESFEGAISCAEHLAEAYANDLDGCSYTGFIDVFEVFETNITDGTEVYSLMRTSDLGTDQYLDKFYDTGTERA